MTDVEFERALSRATWFIHIKDRHPFLWLSNCSHHSGSSSKFNKANKDVNSFFLDDINSKYFPLLTVEVALSQSLDQARTQSSSDVTQRYRVQSLGVHVTKEALVFQRVKGVSQVLASAPRPALEASSYIQSPVSSGLSNTPKHFFHGASPRWTLSQGTSKIQGDGCPRIQSGHTSWVAV